MRHSYVWVYMDTEDEGLKYSVNLELPRYGRPVTRYFNDETLPNEIKWRLGMLNANPRIQGVGERYIDKTYFIEGTEELHSLLLDGAT